MTRSSRQDIIFLGFEIIFGANDGRLSAGRFLAIITGIINCCVLIVLAREDIIVIHEFKSLYALRDCPATFMSSAVIRVFSL